MITNHSRLTKDEVIWGFRLWWPGRGNKAIRDIVKNYIKTLKGRQEWQLTN